MAKKYIYIFLLIIILLFLASCGIVDLKNKAIASETKVIGFIIEMPSMYVSSALMSLKFGYIVKKYTSSPPGASTLIDTVYKDISIFNGTGNVGSRITTNNKGLPNDK